MDFSLTARVEELSEQLDAFMREHVYPVELDLIDAIDREVGPGRPYPQMLVELRERAKSEGLWNLFLPGELGAGLKNWEYGVLCEVMGRCLPAPMVFNCSAPDTGNIEILAEHGTQEQKEHWLEPLLEGEVRSCFAMTEPEVAGSDPTTLQTRAVRDGDEFVINGHKWFSTGAHGAAVAIVMCVTDPEAPLHKRASQILVPSDTPGFEIVRPVSVMGHSGGIGHCEIRIEGCRVPVDNLLGGRGEGFVIAQNRLGPGRIHHCMRAIGTAERAIEMMCKRANERQAFGGPLAEKQFVQDFIARSRIEVDGARLMVLNAAWRMDAQGNKAARREISMIKVVAAKVMMDVLDRAIQVHGALGVSDDTPLALMWRQGRTLRLADGPDEVHKMVIAARELARYK